MPCAYQKEAERWCCGKTSTDARWITRGNSVCRTLGACSARLFSRATHNKLLASINANIYLWLFAVIFAGVFIDLEYIYTVIRSVVSITSIRVINTVWQVSRRRLTKSALLLPSCPFVPIPYHRIPTTTLTVTLSVLYSWLGPWRYTIACPFFTISQNSASFGTDIIVAENWYSPFTGAVKWPLPVS